ncbi:MAG: cell envelope integrity protein TolA [Pseudobdellovibrionaceae bacterium]|jgi:hypothetical protein|nr:cell envelope integrity protein TolA [Pseudobdellovibrionaceae bacterium]
MVADPQDNRNIHNAVQGSKTPFLISVLVHIVVFILVIFGMPHWKRDIELVEPVPVTLVDNIGELTTTDKPPTKAAPKKEEKKPEPKKEEPKKEEKQSPKKQETAKPPAEDVLQPPPKEEKAEKLPDKKPEKKQEPKKEEKKQPPKKEEPKKEDPKKQEQDFENLLKDLTPEDQSKAEEKTPEPAPQTPSVGKFTGVLSMTEMDALRYQLSQCWSIMAGAMNSQDLAVEVRVVVNPDRTVRSAKILDQYKYNSDPFFRAAADAAVRALNNPKCTPLNLPPEKYDNWREMTINFDPRDMF